MNFETEAELQSFIADALRVNGFEDVQREVPCSDLGRCDVFAGDYAIEVKPRLTRSAIDQAASQVRGYARESGRTPVIAGLWPRGEKAKASADVAIRRAQADGITIWAIDESQMFVDYWRQLHQAPQPEPVYSSRVSYSADPLGLAWTILIGGALLLLGAGMQAQKNYAIQPGDTLSKLEREHGLPAGELKRQNPGIDHDQLHPGQRIALPEEKPKGTAKEVPGAATYRISVGAQKRAPAFDTPWATQSKIASLPDGAEVRIIGVPRGQWVHTDQGWVHASQLAAE